MTIPASDAPAYLTLAGGRTLAYRRVDGAGPAILFLPGYMSDMEGSKALALEAWARRQGRAFLRFDYGGCGISEGAFEEQSLANWRDDAIAMIDLLGDQQVVLVGSSMGGWLMLLAALVRPERVAGLIGIAAAPDFTSWGFSDAEKATDPARRPPRPADPLWRPPLRTTRIFWESGRDAEAAGRQDRARLPGPPAPRPGRSLTCLTTSRFGSPAASFIRRADAPHQGRRPSAVARGGSCALIATLAQMLDRS
jgi:pimeloyl-ACP methyl ester carboxylesterase